VWREKVIVFGMRKGGRAWLSTGLWRFRELSPVVGGMSITSGKGTWQAHTCKVLRDAEMAREHVN